MKLVLRPAPDSLIFQSNPFYLELTAATLYVKRTDGPRLFYQEEIREGEEGRLWGPFGADFIEVAKITRSILVRAQSAEIGEEENAS